MPFFSALVNKQMSKAELSIAAPFHSGSKAAHFRELAGAAIVQLGIVATFTSAAVVFWFISLLVA